MKQEGTSVRFIVDIHMRFLSFVVELFVLSPSSSALLLNSPVDLEGVPYIFVKTRRLK